MKIDSESLDEDSAFIKCQYLDTVVSVYADRGGIITSLQFQGKEVLYMDEETLFNKNLSIRGGIPILFPNAGLIPDELKTEAFTKLKQHGFARDLPWLVTSKEYGFVAKLDSNKDTKTVYPYDFLLSTIGEFSTDGSFMITQNLKNLEEKTNLPVSFGLHPYFKVPQGQKQNITFDFDGGDFIKEHFDLWANGETICIDNPNTEMKISIPNHGTLVLKASREYQKIWVWSLPDKDFICIEPVLRDQGGIVINPENVSPLETYSTNFNISFYENQN